MTRKNYAQELVRVRTQREIPDILRDLYVERRYSQQAIADALGVSRWQVNTWLATYGISRTDRAPPEL